ncbi:hypothetical protein Hanom_Chr02g00152801 [Helianthus anomalus]
MMMMMVMMITLMIYDDDNDVKDNDSPDHGRILMEPWQGHGPGKFFGRSANFPHFDRNFVYILCSALANFSAVVLILVSLSFGPGRFNGQDPPLAQMMMMMTYMMMMITHTPCNIIIHVTPNSHPITHNQCDPYKAY